MQKLLAGAGVLLLLNCVWLFLRSGFSNTFYFSLGLFFCFGLYALLYERLHKLRWLTYSIFIFAAMYVGFAALIMVYGRNDTVTFEEDAAIILGAGLRGEEIGRTLQSRLDMGLEYHRQNPAAVIIVSGGIGRGQEISEAQAMARYLESAGVPSHLIKLEGNSHSTYQNMRLSAVILDELFPEGYSLAVITNDFHIYRSIRFTRIAEMGEASSFHANTPLLNLPGALVREVAAIVKMWLIGT